MAGGQLIIETLTGPKNIAFRVSLALFFGLRSRKNVNRSYLNAGCLHKSYSVKCEAFGEQQGENEWRHSSRIKGQLTVDRRVWGEGGLYFKLISLRESFQLSIRVFLHCSETLAEEV